MNIKTAGVGKIAQKGIWKMCAFHTQLPTVVLINLSHSPQEQSPTRLVLLSPLMFVLLTQSGMFSYTLIFYHSEVMVSFYADVIRLSTTYNFN
jgi:hypothetical protein